MDSINGSSPNVNSGPDFDASLNICGLTGLYHHKLSRIDEFYTIRGNYGEMFANIGSSTGVNGHALVRIYHTSGGPTPPAVKADLKAAGAQWDNSRRQYSFHLTTRQMVVDMLRVFAEHNFRICPRVVPHIKESYERLGASA